MSSRTNKRCKMCGKRLNGDATTEYCSKTCEELAREMENENFGIRIKPRAKRRRQPETVKNNCRHEECCHRGHFGNEPCCDYLIHIGKMRPKTISKCQGYEQRIIQKTPRGEVVTIHHTAKDAAQAIGVATNTMKNYLKNRNKELLNGYYFAKEQFQAKKNFVETFTNDAF